MQTVIRRIGAYIRTRDALSWFLVVAGFALIEQLIESIRLHREVGPHGGHHGDVAGGFLLLESLFFTALFVLALAAIVASFCRSTAPLIGAVSGLLISVPLLLVLGVLGALFSYVSPFLGASIPFVAGTALVVTGLIKRAKTVKTCSDAS